MAKPLVIFLFSAFFVACGTFISTVSKLMFSTKALNIHGEIKEFEKPWYQNLLMCVGMMCTFILVFIKSCYNYYKTSKKHSKTVKTKRNWNWLKNLLPSSLDTFSSFLISVALILMPVSLWQMFRGSLIVFTAFFTICYRKRKLFRHEWIGVCLAVTALIILGAVAIISENQSNENSKSRKVWQIILGIGLVLVGQFLSAGQTIVLEVFLHDSNMDELTIVSWGGLWGTVISILFMIIAYFIPTQEGDGLHEDSIDTMVMLGNSAIIVVYSIIYTVLILLFNVSGMFIINMTNALMRNVTEQMRTLFIWLISLFIYYVINHDYGERWVPISFLQLFGFLVMSLGVLIYNGVVHLRVLMGAAYDKTREEREKEREAAILKPASEEDGDIEGERKGLISVKEEGEEEDFEKNEEEEDCDYGNVKSLNDDEVVEGRDGEISMNKKGNLVPFHTENESV